MNYKWLVVDLQGRLWKRTMTHIKAVKLAELIYQTKGVQCVVKPC